MDDQAVTSGGALRRCVLAALVVLVCPWPAQVASARGPVAPDIGQIASGQSQVAPDPVQPAPAAGGDVAPPAPLTLAATGQADRTEVRGAREKPLQLATPQLPFGLAGECTLCLAVDRLSLTSNVPWSAGVSSVFGIAGARVGLSVMGSRNYRLPRYMASPLGSTVDTTPPVATALSDLSSSRVEWTISARVQRTLRTLQGGQTIGVVGDVWLPLNEGADPARQRTTIPALPASVFRFGVNVGF